MFNLFVGSSVQRLESTGLPFRMASSPASQALLMTFSGTAAMTSYTSESYTQGTPFALNQSRRSR